MKSLATSKETKLHREPRSAGLNQAWKLKVQQSHKVLDPADV